MKFRRRYRIGSGNKWVLGPKGFLMYVLHFHHKEHRCAWQHQQWQLCVNMEVSGLLGEVCVVLQAMTTPLAPRWSILKTLTVCLHIIPFLVTEQSHYGHSKFGDWMVYTFGLLLMGITYATSSFMQIMTLVLLIDATKNICVLCCIW